jgi:hypothetical protein
MRASRAALIYDSWSTFTRSIGYLALGGLTLLIVGIVAFSQAERNARDKGLIDEKVM